MGDAAAADDNLLVARCLAGDATAYEPLVRRHQAGVQRLVRRYLGRDDEAVDDMAQEVFVKAYYSLGSFHGRSSFTSWLYRITVNQCLDELKRRQRSARRLQERAAEFIPDSPSAVVNAPESEGSQPQAPQPDPAPPFEGALREAIEHLPPPQRSVVILKELEQLSYQEVAAALRTSVGTVKSRLARARATLRRRLEPSLRHRQGHTHDLPHLSHILR